MDEPSLHIFISHAHADAATAEAIRRALEEHGHTAWIDRRELSAGDELEDSIQRAIRRSSAFIVLLGRDTVNSAWVRKECQLAMSLRSDRGDSFRVIPLLLDGMKPAAVATFLGTDLLGHKLDVGPGGIDAALPRLLEAIGVRLPAAWSPPVDVESTPIAELTLKLSQPSLDTADGKQRAAATACLIYQPADRSQQVESGLYHFTAPLGPIEAGDLSWYLERYINWPTGVFRERADRLEKTLPEWGRLLYQAVDHKVARGPLELWRQAKDGVERRFSILVDATLPDGSAADAVVAAAEAATLLLSLPWELVHDDVDYLFAGAHPVRVRRRLPGRALRPTLVTDAPLRILLVSPRPEDDVATYIDHRVSARPLVEAIGRLGRLAHLTILEPPTFTALTDEVGRAHDAKQGYHVVHFDGHGVYDRRHGLGALCFEHADDQTKLSKRRSDVVDATRLAETLHGYRVPLFFLEACQSAMAKKDPTASVAGKLLDGGVASVAAMSHSVLVTTAAKFITVFYRELLAGQRIGQAMLRGQQVLRDDTNRGRAFTGDLHLQDWFVPVLFQEQVDPPLVKAVPSKEVEAVIAEGNKLRLGELPDPPPHGFLGRSRELLAAERLLVRARHVVLRGEGGEGKTTLAAELARWLVATERYRRAVFVSVEVDGNERALLYGVGRQLVPDYQARAAQDEKQAWSLLERALREDPTVIVVDNMESVLRAGAGGKSGSGSESESVSSPGAGAGVFEPQVLDKLLALCTRMAAAGSTRVVFTSREALPAPFEDNHVAIGRLDRNDAIALVARVLGEEEQRPQVGDAGESEDEIAKLVDAVQCHARACTLLAREVAARGVRSATRDLTGLMVALQARHPNDRERSLYASVELSLKRLGTGTPSPFMERGQGGEVTMRDLIRPLGVFQGGSNLATMAMVLGLDPEKPQLIQKVAQALVAVGLATQKECGYLLLDPALGPMLLEEMSEEERESARARWVEATVGLIGFLYQQRFQDVTLAAQLTLLELPNLLAALDRLAATADAEQVVGASTQVEGLLANLGRPRALARASQARAAAADRLGEWGRAHCNAAIEAVERLLEAGQHQAAVRASEQLLLRAQAAGEAGYPEASYDLAMAHISLGRAQQRSGAADAALGRLDEARRRFQALADAGNRAAARMASVALTDRADCLRALGRLDEAAEVYEECIILDGKRGDTRDVAVGKGQLGTVRLDQRRYADALTAWTEALETFERLGETRTVATAWHQIGMAHQDAGQYDAAERAYQASLQLKVRLGNRSGEANTLSQLGLLYAAMDRLEESVRFLRQATDIYAEAGDLAGEGRQRSNIAIRLIKLGRHDEARRELLRAIECGKPFGHASEPWKTFDILHDLERAVDNDRTAMAARGQAVRAYLAYRRAGAESQTRGGQLANAVVQAIRSGDVAAVASQLSGFEGDPQLPSYLPPLLTALHAILAGSRDPALAADPRLEYDDAAEILLLLDALAS